MEAVLRFCTRKMWDFPIETQFFKSPTALEIMTKKFQLEFNRSIIVCLIYIPDKKLDTNALSNFDLVLQQLAKTKSECYVMGDLNMDFKG